MAQSSPLPSVTVLGIPFDQNSSFLRGTAQAPSRIREALYSPAHNLCAENGLDLGATTNWQDSRDMTLSDSPQAFDEIQPAIAEILARGEKALLLGGDHSVTWPVLRAYAQHYPGLTILQLDAHPDLYDELDGNRNSHGCPFARIMEEGLADRLVQVGIRALTPHLREQAERFKVEIVEMRDWNPAAIPELKAPVYLSIDLDCLDPAFAPGVSHPAPGGLSCRDVLTIIQSLDGILVGADIVEYNPVRDLMGLTAVVGAKLLKELLAQMLANDI
ncbi:agmatinase [Candidatus Neomarinimicrobiota bacterium]